MMYRGRDASNSLGTEGLCKMAFPKRSGLLEGTRYPTTTNGRAHLRVPALWRGGGRRPNTAQTIGRGKVPVR